jgi:hypothetical protein
MTDLHLIIPPEELVDKWVDEYPRAKVKLHNLVIYIAGKATQWGADAELDACLEWISKQDWTWTKAQLLAARRPKPLRETDQALTDLEQLLDVAKSSGIFNPPDNIRRCLERLKKLEESTDD